MWKVFQIYDISETFNKDSVELTIASLPNCINPDINGLVELFRCIYLKKIVLMKQPSLYINVHLLVGLQLLSFRNTIVLSRRRGDLDGVFLLILE